VWGGNYMGRVDAGEERDSEFAILHCAWVLVLYALFPPK